MCTHTLHTPFHPSHASSSLDPFLSYLTPSPSLSVTSTPSSLSSPPLPSCLSPSLLSLSSPPLLSFCSPPLLSLSSSVGTDIGSHCGEGRAPRVCLGLDLDHSCSGHVFCIPAHVSHVPLPQPHALQVHQLREVDTVPVCVTYGIGGAFSQGRVKWANMLLFFFQALLCMLSQP